VTVVGAIAAGVLAVLLLAILIPSPVVLTPRGAMRRYSDPGS